MNASRFVAVMVNVLVPLMVMAEVRLGEVFYDPEGTDTGLEWVEIHNLGSEVQNLGGWLLDANGPNLLLPPLDLPAGAVLLIHTNAAEFQAPNGLEIWFQNSTGMGNTHGFVGLWRAEQQTVENLADYMEYGSTGHSWVGQAVTAGLWPADSFAPDVEEGHSLLRIGTGNGVADWADESEPLPGAGSTAVGELMAPSLQLDEGLPVLQWSFDGNTRRFEIREGAAGNAETLLGSVDAQPGRHSYSFTDTGWMGGERDYYLDARRHDGSLDRLGGPYRLDEARTGLPSGIRLVAARPNPFNPGTMLTFDLARAGSVSLALHDLLGRQVQRLELGTMRAGSHTVPLNMENETSGLYFAVLQGPEGQRSVMKLLLAR